MEGNNGIVKDVCEDGMRNLGGRLVLMLMRAGILVGELEVVAVGVISISEKRFLSATQVECLGVVFGLVGGDILKTYPCSGLYLRKLLRLNPGG